MNKPMNNKPMNNTPAKMKLLILLCLAALPAMSVRAADNAEKPAAKRGSVEATASDHDPFWDDKSPECQFLAGAWEGYVAGLTASADRDSDYQATLVRSFHRMQRGVNANARAYENTKQKCSDTDEHKALFLQVEKVARLVDKAFVKRFSKPTNLANYERWLGMDWGDNAETPAAKNGSAEAIASLKQDEAGIRDALSGTWVTWKSENDAAAKSQLTSIGFHFQGTDGSDRNVVTWETVVDGKRTVRTGTSTVEKSANLFFPSTTTWCVKIRDISPDYPADAGIHLVNVRVDLDNRLSTTEVVLKFRDAFYTEFSFRKNI